MQGISWTTRFKLLLNVAGSMPFRLVIMAGVKGGTGILQPLWPYPQRSLVWQLDMRMSQVLMATRSAAHLVRPKLRT